MNQSVQSHDQAEHTHKIVPNVNQLIEIKDFKFRFKKDKLGNQRQSIELKLPVPNANGLAAILETGGKDLELLLDVVKDCVRSVAAGIVGDDEKISQESFPISKLDWHAIATAPRAERTTIPEETWTEFTKDYLEVMPGVSGKNADQLGNAIYVYTKKFSLVKTDKETLGKLKEQLGLYMTHSKKAEEFTELLEMLLNKLEGYLKSDDVAQLVANL